MKKFMATFTILSTLSATILLSGCMLNSRHMQEEVSKRVAFPAFMHPRTIDAEPFNLKAYERVHEEGKTINIYIEGDGFAWVSRKRKSLNPTPKNPISLRLAAMDGSTNVIYLARPCQYTGWQNEGRCPQKYWTSHKYSPTVVNSFHKALDDIKRRYQAPNFNLIGYSGGGTIATLVAADRDDVLSIRTVAGNLDIDYHTNFHKVTKLTGSLNPKDIAAKIAHIPQRHFVGSMDQNVTPEIYYSYAQAMGVDKCLNYNFVDGADHTEGWAEHWTMLVKQPVECEEYVPAPVTMELTPEIEEKIEEFNNVIK